MNSANGNGAFGTVKENSTVISSPLQITTAPQLTLRPVMKVMPLSELKNSGFTSSDNTINKENSIPSVIPKTKSGRKSENSPRTRTPLAVAVARRNARERNRVKQVNNGFAALRQHIPAEIAELFEQAAIKGASKKLSKVETLRMAVEYIRQLESMLTTNSEGHSTTTQTTTVNLPATPPPETNKQQQNCFFAIKPRRMFNPASPESSDTMDNDTQIAIINGQQYIKIPGTQTFKLLVHEQFDNDDDDEDDNSRPDMSVLSSASSMATTIATNTAMTTMSDDSLPGSFIDHTEPMEIVNGINIANRYDTITTNAVPLDCTPVSSDFNMAGSTAVMTIVKEEVPEYVDYTTGQKDQQTIFYDPKTNSYSVAVYDPLSNQFKMEVLEDDVVAAAGLQINLVAGDNYGVGSEYQ